MMDDMARIESQLQGIHDQLSYQNTLLTTAAVAYMERQRKQAIMERADRHYQDEYYRLLSTGMTQVAAHEEAMRAATVYSYKWWYKNWYKRDYFVWAARTTFLTAAFLILNILGLTNSIFWAWLDHVCIGHPFSTDGHYSWATNWTWIWVALGLALLVYGAGWAQKSEMKSGEFFRKELGVTV